MSNVLRDARLGCRLLRKEPGFTTVAVLTLAVGIAATTAIFSVIYATYLAPLPYRDPGRLVVVWSRVEDNRAPTAPADFLDWRRQAHLFEGLHAWGWRRVNLASGDRPEQVQAGPVTPGFLSMLGYGQPLALGRDFLEEEGTVGRDQVVILSHRLWQRRLGGDRGVIGRHVRIDGKPHTIVGVLGAGPADRNQNQLWLPLTFTPEDLRREPGGRWLTVMGRLKAGVTLEQANADMAVVSANLSRAYPASNTGWTTSVEPFRNDFVSDDTKAALWLLVGAVAFVLLIACANVASLLLARGTTRQRELAVRAALGASRAAILRQLVTESLVLALLGGALGVALAYALMHVILALMPPYTLPTEVEVRLSVPVLLFTLATCVLSGLLFGSAPAWQGARTDIAGTLKEADRSLGGGRDRLRRALVAVELALALTLLTGGALAIHAFFKLATVDLGFGSGRLLTFSLPVPEGQLTRTEQIDAFYRELLDRIQALPGVVSASVATGLPLQGHEGVSFSVSGTPLGDPSRRPMADFNRVSADYFETLGVSLTRGRAFTADDRAGGLRVAVVNEAFVKQYLGDVDPLVQRVVLSADRSGAGSPGTPIEWQIVGVHADVRGGGPREGPVPAIAVPFSQSPWPSARIAVRTAGDPAHLQGAIADVVHSLNPDLPMGDVRTMKQVVGEAMASDRFHMALFAGFAAVALLLAAIGIYGVTSFAVAQRTREIGIRKALGADRGHILRQVLREGMTTGLAGAALGCVGAYLVGRAMQGMLYGVDAVDPTALGAVSLTLLGAAFLACLIPARRAASIDPVVALRQE